MGDGIARTLGKLYLENTADGKELKRIVEKAASYGTHVDRIAALEAENAKLKLRLKEYADTTAEHHKSEKAAWAEVERLIAERKLLDSHAADVELENERLRKTLAVAYDREAESDDENARTIAGLREAYKDGVVEGLQQYAWWADGVQYVGTCGTTLKQAIDAAHTASEEGE